ncbi:MULTISPECIES: MOSC domain-containing protein [unclassified Shewanella]|uniref:MOSC domain-containing protein n=1 Tax=unclassified Shewanella TaxID=196818 RepID=UPI001BC81DA3|nr:MULTISPECIES: MOSC domain-containing protein [unclassified Shewanella]GIU14363.1 molybdenum cofactor sulfurase [Shewanella sp. MBTL60-112-B1]GIU29605.1 molybdenum cofactor sulfurase [Shewanella sp. MBTL60-112-B2]
MAPQILVEQISGIYHGEAITELGSVTSGINHKGRATELQVGIQAVAGDAQADPKHHGGLDRVLHHFPREHYGQYRRWDLMDCFKDAPAMGENISTVGLDESQVHIGDIIKIGEVELQVTQPRSPCFKLNLQFGHKEFALAMQQSGRCGWFYRVLKPGIIYETDKIVLLERLTEISVAEAMHIYFLAEFNLEQYQRLMDCEGLAVAWVNSLQRRIENKAIEDWQMRLYGPNK